MTTYRQSSRFQEKETQQRMIWLWSQKTYWAILTSIGGGGGKGASSAVPTYPANVQEAVVEA